MIPTALQCGSRCGPEEAANAPLRCPMIHGRYPPFSWFAYTQWGGEEPKR